MTPGEFAVENDESVMTSGGMSKIAATIPFGYFVLAAITMTVPRGVDVDMLHRNGSRHALREGRR